MMTLKKGVRLTGIRPEMIIGLMVAAAVYEEFGVEMVVTTALDGKHSKTSLHYAGCAVDLRTRNVPKDKLKALFAAIKKRLTVDFDVILERNHIHMEAQPRRPA